MSEKKTSSWLRSYNSYDNDFNNVDHQRKAVKIAITSGKGGVGKTSASVKISKLLASLGHKVLLIDCDYNLSNTSVKLNLPLSDNLISLVTAQKSFDECLHKEGNFHLLSGCNGSLEMFDQCLNLEKFIIDIMGTHEHEYDYILLDCPAGIKKDTLTLNAYCDHRIVVVTPDRSSITDSYSIIKILNQKYGVKSNHLLVNKLTHLGQYQKIVKTLTETVDHFLNCQLRVLGGVTYETVTVDRFDTVLFEEENSSLHKSFLKLVHKLSEECTGSTLISGVKLPLTRSKQLEQDVQLTVS